MMRSNSQRDTSETTDRGQVLITAAVGLAILLLAIGVALNTAYFAERDRAAGVEYYGDSAQRTVTQVEYGLEQGLRHTNHDQSAPSNPAREAQLTGGGGTVASVLTQIGDQQTRRGGYVEGSVQSVNADGIRVWQPGYSNLTVSSQPSYTVVTGVSATRDFAVTVTGDGVVPADQSDAFVVQFAGHNNVVIGQNPSNSNEILVSDNPGDITNGNTCTVAIQSNTSIPENSYVTVSFNNGRVNGQECDALPRTEDISDISFENADNVEASLNLVVNTGSTADVFPDPATSGKTVQSSPSNNPSEPEAHTAIYSMVVDVTITTPTSDIETPVRIAPGIYADSTSITE